LGSWCGGGRGSSVGATEVFAFVAEVGWWLRGQLAPMGISARVGTPPARSVAIGRSTVASGPRAIGARGMRPTGGFELLAHDVEWT
jgi:hypothetical protein